MPKRKNSEKIQILNDIILKMQSGISEIRQFKREIEKILTTSLLFELKEIMRDIGDSLYDLDLIALKEERERDR